MERSRKVTVVIDTNLWISFLIGKRTANLVSILSRPNIIIAVSEQALDELKLVVGRDKFRKYFPMSYGQKLFDFIHRRAKIFKVFNVPTICRDPKDNYLLALSEMSKSDYLITGDNDLLVLQSYDETEILRLEDFIKKES